MNKTTQVIAAIIALLVCLGIMARLGGCKLPSIVPPPDAPNTPEASDTVVTSAWAELLDDFADILVINGELPFMERRVKYAINLEPAWERAELYAKAGPRPNAVDDVLAKLRGMADADAPVDDAIRAKYVAALRDAAGKLRE